MTPSARTAARLHVDVGARVEGGAELRPVERVGRDDGRREGARVRVAVKLHEAHRPHRRVADPRKGAAGSRQR